MAQYGLEIAEVLMPEELEPPLSEPSYQEVGPEYLDELQTRADKERWAEYVERHADRLPASWLNPMIDRLEDEGYISVGE